MVWFGIYYLSPNTTMQLLNTLIFLNTTVHREYIFNYIEYITCLHFHLSTSHCAPVNKINQKMSTNNYDYLRNISAGRTDWKIKVRIIREWRPRSNTGEIFKSHNLLLLDSKVAIKHFKHFHKSVCNVSFLFKDFKLNSTELPNASICPCLSE